MPRYFFNILHSSAVLDTEGTEFPDNDAARTAATRLCGEMIKEMDGKFWDAPTWRLQVTGEDHGLLFIFTFSAQEFDSDERA